MTLGRLHMLVTIAAALVVGSELKAFVLLSRWRAKLPEVCRDRRRRRRAIASIAASIALALVLLALPYALGIPWSEAFRTMPDASGLLLATQAMGLAMGLLKAHWMRRASREVAQP